MYSILCIYITSFWRIQNLISTQEHLSLQAKLPQGIKVSLSGREIRHLPPVGPHFALTRISPHPYNPWVQD